MFQFNGDWYPRRISYLLPVLRFLFRSSRLLFWLGETALRMLLQIFFVWTACAFVSGEGSRCIEFSTDN